MLHFMMTIDEVFLREADYLLYEVLWEPLGLPEDTKSQFPVDGEEMVFVALFLGQVVGTLVLINNSSTAEVRHMAIRSEYQQTGIGKQLLDQAFQYVYRKGIKEVDVFARSTSIGFWEKNGFTPVTDWLDHEVFKNTDIKFKRMVKTLPI